MITNCVETAGSWSSERLAAFLFHLKVLRYVSILFLQRDISYIRTKYQ